MNKMHNVGRILSMTALLGSSGLMTASTHANTPEPPGLFSMLPGKSEAVLPEQAIAGRSKAVKIHYAKLNSGRFFVSLPDGVSFEAVRDLQQKWGNNQSAWVGRASGDTDSRVIIGTSGDAVAGTFAYEGRLFKLEPRANGSHVLSEVLTSDPAPGLDPVEVFDTAAPGTGEAAIAIPAADGGPVMDVLVAYTPAIVSMHGTQGAEALITLAVAEANQAYANSGMAPRLNLVATVLTNYAASGNMETDLIRLRGTSDGYMDELHTLRNTYGADLVSLIEDEPQYCGIAYRMASLSTGFASSAFSVVHRTCATGYYSFAHELGHNQGAHHDHNNASGAIYDYAYGYQDPYNNFRTVMAYNCSSNCTRVDHFSNPNILYNGQPSGAADYADNALAIGNTSATVAAFRQQAAQNPPSAPSGLSAAASSHTTIDLEWVDTSADESGFDLERSADGLNFTQIASLAANSTRYTDDNLQSDTLYSYRARSWNSAGNSSYSNVEVVATDPAPPITDQVANADLPVAGSVSGTYQNTWSSDSTYQTITERSSGGKPKNRHGYLEHKWSFQVQSGNSVILFADVTTTTSADSFTFAYSTDNSQYINMFTVDSGNSGLHQFTLPSSLNGTLYIRARDNVRQAGNVTSHSLNIDQLLVRSENGTGTPAPSAPTGLSATSAGTDRITVTWADTSDNEYGFTVEQRIDSSAQWNPVATTGANTTSFTATGLQAATFYHYRVQAFNGSGASEFSNSASAVTDDQPATSQIQLNASGRKVKGRQVVDLAWTGGTQSSEIDIYRDGELIAELAANTGTYADNIGKKGGGTYQYQVCVAASTECSDTEQVVF